MSDEGEFSSLLDHLSPLLWDFRQILHTCQDVVVPTRPIKAPPPSIGNFTPLLLSGTYGSGVWYRELTDLLYYKQTQLETIASEKAAAEFQLEKEMMRTQESQVEDERNRVSRRASTSWEEYPDIKAIEPFPLHNRHMVGASMQLQKAVKVLDSGGTGAVKATRFLWWYPIARVI